MVLQPQQRLCYSISLFGEAFKEEKSPRRTPHSHSWCQWTLWVALTSTNYLLSSETCLVSRGMKFAVLGKRLPGSISQLSVNYRQDPQLCLFLIHCFSFSNASSRCSNRWGRSLVVSYNTVKFASGCEESCTSHWLLNLNIPGNSLSWWSLTSFLGCGEIIVYELVTENNLISSEKV